MKKKWHLKQKYKFLIFLILVISSVLLWSRYISTSGLVIREYKVVNSNIQSSFDGLKIVHFTDLHYGRTVKMPELEYLVKEINALKPDLIFFTGDLVDKDIKISGKEINDITNALGELKAKVGKYAVKGNHDFSLKEYDDIIKNSNFINLDNAYDIIYSPSYDSIYIAGLEPEVKGKPNINSITDYLKPDEQNKNKLIPPYKIVLLHTPDTITKLNNYQFNLVLAGHSHNGQVRLPFIGALIKPVGAKKYYNAYYKINNTDLYISGGIGTSNMNFRFFDKPSFNFYRLVSK